MARHLWALLIAAVAAAAFLGPALLPGRALVPFPPENIPPLRSEAHERGLDAEDLVVGNPSGGDKYNQSLAWDRIARDGLRGGHVPLWTRDLGGGAPVVPQMGQVYMPWTWLLRCFDPTTIYGPWFFAHQCLLGLFLYHFLRRLGVQHAAALFGMTCAVIGLWTQARVHHNVILSAALPLFCALACVRALFDGGGWLATGLLAFAVGVPWLGGFAPVALQSTYLVLAYALLCAWLAGRGQRRRPLLRVGIALAVGALIACPQMLPVLNAARDTARGVPSAAALEAHALSWPHLLTLFWPDLLAWGQPAFYGGLDQVRIPFAALVLLDIHSANTMNWPETVFAIGVCGAALALGGLAHRPRRAEAWFFAGAAGVGFLLAAAAPPFLQLSAFVPGARSGDVRRFLFLPAMSLPVLAAFGVDRWLAGARLFGVRAALAVVAIGSGVLVFLHLGDADAMQHAYAELAVARHPEPGVSVEAFTRGAAPTEAADNQARLVATFLRAALAAGIGFVALGFAARRPAVPVLLALVAVTELWHAGRGPVVAVPAQRVAQPPRILEPALAATRSATPRPRFHRLDRSRAPTQLVQPNLGAFYGLEDLAIYTSLAPRRLEELFTCLEPPQPGVPPVALGGAGVQSLRQVESLAHPLADVLGLTFVLTDAELTGIDASALVDRTPRDWPGPERLYERTTCAPRATFTTRVRIVPDRAERLRLLADPHRDAVHEVLLEEPLPQDFALGSDGAGATITVRTWEDETVVLDVDAQAAGVLRIADPWDDGWRATLDEEPARLYVSDHDLRAVAMPAGRHILALTYDAPRVLWPPRLGLFGAAVAFLFAGVGVVGLRRRRSP